MDRAMDYSAALCAMKEGLRAIAEGNVGAQWVYTWMMQGATLEAPAPSVVSLVNSRGTLQEALNWIRRGRPVTARGIEEGLGFDVGDGFGQSVVDDLQALGVLGGVMFGEYAVNVNLDAYELPEECAAFCGEVSMSNREFSTGK